MASQHYFDPPYVHVSTVLTSTTIMRLATTLSDVAAILTLAVSVTAAVPGLMSQIGTRDVEQLGHHDIGGQVRSGPSKRSSSSFRAVLPCSPIQSVSP